MEEVLTTHRCNDTDKDQLFGKSKNFMNFDQVDQPLLPILYCLDNPEQITLMLAENRLDQISLFIEAYYC